MNPNAARGYLPEIDRLAHRIAHLERQRDEVNAERARISRRNVELLDALDAKTVAIAEARGELERRIQALK